MTSPPQAGSSRRRAYVSLHRGYYLAFTVVALSGVAAMVLSVVATRNKAGSMQDIWLFGIGALLAVLGLLGQTWAMLRKRPRNRP